MPLHKLLRTKTAFEWIPQCQEAFDLLKDKLIHYPVLVHPNFAKDFILETDASFSGLGAVLSQQQDDLTVHPIAYASRALLDPETRYSIWEIEVLAVQWALRYFHPYVYGRKTYVYCDQSSVKFALTSKNYADAWDDGELHYKNMISY